MFEQNTFLWFHDYEIIFFMIVHFANWRSYMYVNFLQAVRTVTVMLWGHWAMSVTRSRVSASVVQAWQDSSVTSVSPITMGFPTLDAQVNILLYIIALKNKATSNIWCKVIIWIFWYASWTTFYKINKQDSSVKKKKKRLQSLKMYLQWMFMCHDFSACNCDPEGSVSLQCDTNGNCPCRTNIEGQHCDRCMENKYNITAGCIGKQNHSCINV